MQRLHCSISVARNISFRRPQWPRLGRIWPKFGPPSGKSPDDFGPNLVEPGPNWQTLLVLLESWPSSAKNDQHPILAGSYQIRPLLVEFASNVLDSWPTVAKVGPDFERGLCPLRPTLAHIRTKYCAAHSGEDRPASRARAAPIPERRLTNVAYRMLPPRRRMSRAYHRHNMPSTHPRRPSPKKLRRSESQPPGHALRRGDATPSLPGAWTSKTSKRREGGGAGDVFPAPHEQRNMTPSASEAGPEPGPTDDRPGSGEHPPDLAPQSTKALKRLTLARCGVDALSPRCKQ